MRDRLSRSKVVETELAKPLLDALLRVAQGSRRAGPEHSDALAEKVGPRTAVLPGHCPQQQPREVGAAVGGAAEHTGQRSAVPGSCQSKMDRACAELCLVRNRTGEQHGCLFSHLVWDLLRITPGTTKVCDLI